MEADKQGVPDLGLLGPVLNSYVFVCRVSLRQTGGGDYGKAIDTVVKKYKGRFADGLCCSSNQRIGDVRRCQEALLCGL